MTDHVTAKATTRSLVRQALISDGHAMTADDVWMAIHSFGRTASPSGVRSRLAEMVRDGEVDVADRFGTTLSGNRCMRYRLHRESRVPDRNGNPM